ncbi:MAG: hypothetical protein ABIJ22_01725, partial [Patescibacteria group bacterium]
MKIKQKQKINFRSLIINRRYLVISVIIGVAGLLVVFLGITPQINQTLDLNRKIKTEQQKLELLIRKTSDLENIDAQEAYASVDLVDQVLPSKKPLLELLAVLSTIAGKSEVVFTNMSLSPGKIASESAQFINSAKSNTGQTKVTPVIKEDRGFLDVELKVSGLFSNVEQFFLDVERVAPLIIIKSISLNIKSEEIIMPTDQVDAELVLSVYYFTKTVSASLESSLPSIGSKEQEIISEISSYYYPSIEVQQQIIGGGLEDLFG